MNTDQIVRRARSAIGEGCRYKLGKGGKKPNGPVPWDSAKYCDCSGFTSWVLKLDRKTDHPFYKNQNGGWINTTAMWLDGMKPVGFFERLDRAILGALLVYPGVGSKKGHCGVISKVAIDGTIESVIHCSKTNDSRYGDAIQENDAPILTSHPDSIVILYHGIDTPLTRSEARSEKYG